MTRYLTVNADAEGWRVIMDATYEGVCSDHPVYQIRVADKRRAIDRLNFEARALAGAGYEVVVVAT